MGSHLVYDLVKRGSEVKVLVRENSDRNKILEVFRYYSEDADHLFELIHWAIGDVTDRISLEDAFEEVDFVYHTAAFVSFAGIFKKQIMKVNVVGTANIVDLCLAKGIKKLCFVSSIASIVVPVDGTAGNEDLIWKPEKNASIYSISKLKSEMEVWRGITEGLSAVIVNPSVILGPGDWSKGSPGLFHAIAKGIPFYTNGSTGFVDVRDVSEIMISLMDSDIEGERFILNSENIGYRDFFNLIAKSMHKESKPVYLNALFAQMILLVDTIRVLLLRKEPLVTKQSLRIAYKKLVYSNQKIRKTLKRDFRPVQESINDISLLYGSRNN